MHEFTTIRLVPRESGSTPNQHPATIDGAKMRELLSSVRFDLRDGGQAALFARDELDELIDPLTEAFSAAGPDDDVLLLSSSRRGGGILAQPYAITARMFVQAGAMQLILNDARREFMNQYLGSRAQPEFTFGSRTRAGQVSLRSTAATNRRADWLSLPLTASAAAAAPAAASPAVVSAPVATPAAGPSPAPATAQPVSPPSATPAAPTLRPRDPGFADEVEQRLTTLKRLRDRGLISEDEYQQKRREILQLL